MRCLLIACFCLFAQASKAAELRELEALGPTNRALYLTGVMDGIRGTTAV